MSSKKYRISESKLKKGGNVRELRCLHKITQAEFGFRIGVSGGSVSDWERGIINIPKSAIKNICREFDVTEDWLLGKSVKAPVVPEPVAPYSKLGRKEKKLLKEIEDLLGSGDQAIKADLSQHIQMLSAWVERRKKK